MKTRKTLKLRPFTEQDWWAFAGCDSDTPLVCYVPNGPAVIVDGPVVAVIDLDDDPTDGSDGTYHYSSHADAVSAAELVLYSYARKMTVRVKANVQVR